jgi:hypothetical protein
VFAVFHAEKRREVAPLVLGVQGLPAALRA